MRLSLSYLRKLVFVGKYDAQNGTSCDQILNSEGIEVGVVGGLVIVEHQVDDICGCSNEDELESSVPQAPEGVCPKKVCERGLSMRYAYLLQWTGVPRYRVTYTTRYRNCDLKEMPDAL
jgi:hypothetical protein